MIGLQGRSLLSPRGNRPYHCAHFVPGQYLSSEMGTVAMSPSVCSLRRNNCLAVSASFRLCCPNSSRTHHASCSCVTLMHARGRNAAPIILYVTLDGSSTSP